MTHAILTWCATLAGCALLLAHSSATAGDLVYQPVNPSFGGFPGNSAHLLNLADIQNQFTESSSGGGFPDISFPDISIDLGGGEEDGETGEEGSDAAAQ